MQSWSDYLALGTQSFARISDPAYSRRVGMRLLFGILKQDPQAYLVSAYRKPDSTANSA